MTPICPPGWRCVPEILSARMIIAGGKIWPEGLCGNVWNESPIFELLYAALAAAPPAPSPWRPISEAPRDGTLIIVGRNMGNFGFVRGTAYYENSGNGIEGWIARGFSEPPGELGLAHPTHWMPLPQPPEEEK